MISFSFDFLGVFGDLSFSTWESFSFDLLIEISVSPCLVPLGYYEDVER